MKIWEMLKKYSYKEIENAFVNHYGDDRKRECHSLYNWLSIMEPEENPERKLYVYITAYNMHGDELKSFSQSNPDVDFDVSVYEMKNGKKISRSIAATSHMDFIECDVDEKTMKDYSCENILAHCFWEIIASGSENRK
ncbi:MAG: hypothetical protein IJF18_04880 [Oscillospiraceae bacterium]|nr:hypothetical protein [Oscillospiraceae bacterium]